MQFLAILLSIVSVMAVEGDNDDSCSRGSYQLSDFQCSPHVSRCQYWKMNLDMATTAFCCHKPTSYCNVLKIHRRAPTARGCRCLGLELKTVIGSGSESSHHADGVSSANGHGNRPMNPENAAPNVQHMVEQWKAPFPCVDNTTVDVLAELFCSLSSVAIDTAVAGYGDTVDRYGDAITSELVLRLLSYLESVDDSANTNVADTVVIPLPEKTSVNIPTVVDSVMHATFHKDSTKTDASTSTTSYDPSLSVPVWLRLS